MVSATICQVGAKGMYNQDDYRTILSFDTSTLVKGNFSSAVLTITRQTLQGTLTPLIVDIKQGTFGPSTTLSLSAYGGAASAYQIGLISIPSSDGSSTSFNIPSSSLQYLTGASRTQIRLRQNLSTSTPGFSPSILQIYDGQATLTVQ